MPLEKQYDRAQVLETATLAFWRHGYEATSINDLVEETGLSRGSLYSAFDGKRGLFIECLTHYDLQYRSGFLDEVAKGKEPRAAILAVFEAAARPLEDSRLPKGCLVVNTASEVSPHDPEIRAIVNQSLSAVETFFKSKLTAARAEGSVSDATEPGAMAKLLLGLFLGLRVFMRSDMDRAAVNAVNNHVRALLT